MGETPAAPHESPLRRFRRQAGRLVELDRDTAEKVDVMFFDPFQIVGQELEDVAVSLAREAALVADLRRLRKAMAPSAWLLLPVDVPRIDIVKRCLDAASYRKIRLVHVILDGRPEREIGIVFHPIHNRLTWAVAAKGGRSTFRSYMHKGTLPLAERLPHEAATVDLILLHCDENHVVAVTDGMLAGALADLDITPAVEAPRPSPTTQRVTRRRGTA